MFKKISYLLFFTLSFNAVKLNAQDPGSNNNLQIVNTLVPPSPNASSLGKYGDYTADLYTGIPNISVPLTDITYYDLNVPVSLSYHASGIRVDEIAPWVGLGWSLNAGGVITRTVRGAPDDNFIHGYWVTSAYMPATIDECTNWTFLSNAMTRSWDTEPDEYYYNVGGLSGRFMVGADKICHPIPYSNIKIEYGDFDGATKGFKITDGKGTIYYFNDKESAMSNGEPSSQFTSSWYMSKIISAQHNATISFEYEDFTHTVHYQRQDTRFVPMDAGGTFGDQCPGAFEIFNFNDITYNAKRLKKISSPLGYIQFTKQVSARTDLPADNALEHIYSYNADGQLLKHFLFEYGYTSNRLMLNKVWDYSSTGTFKPPYQFNYNTTPLPPRLSFAQDFWGYYNGMVSNQSLFEQFGVWGYLSDGGDLRPNTTFTKAQVLEKITYPTGGYTQFDYEGNTYGYDQNNLAINDVVPIESATSATAEALVASHSLEDSQTTNFTIDHEQMISVSATAFKQAPYSGGDLATAYLYAITGTITPLVYPFNGSIDPNSGLWYFNVTPGTYKIVANANSELCEYIKTTIKVNFTGQTGSTLVKNRLGPALRIKTITSNDGINTTSKITKYTYVPLSEIDRSSGHILSTPNYFIPPIRLIHVPPLTQQPGDCPYYERTCENHAYLGASHGRNVIYTSVIEEEDLSGTPNGKTVSEFSFSGSLGEIKFPFAPPTYNDYKNGLLLKKSIYNQSGQIVSDVSNTYTTDPINNKFSLNGLVVQTWIFYDGLVISIPTQCFPGTFSWGSYQTNSEWIYLSNSTSKLYYPTNPSQYTQTSTNYFYTNPAHANLTRKQVTLSDGSILNDYVKYPSDYTGTGTFPTNAISTMVSKHILDIPMEQYSTIDRTGSATQISSGKINTFKINGSYISTDQEKQFGFSVFPFPLTSYVQGFINTTTGAFTNDSRYEKVNQFTQYDANNNAVELASRDNTYGLIRNPDNGDVWAKVQHGTYAEIAYTGFEHGNISSAFTHWTYNYAGIIATSAQNGQKAYNLSTGGAITTQQTLSLIQQFKVSFWLQGGTASATRNGTAVTLRQGAVRNGWTYYETIVSGGVIQISGTGIIDEVRLYPQSARMESYTYKEGIGLISECNENNQTAFWEYDEFNRLKFIKDQDGNILKKEEYQYQQPQ